MAFVLRGECTAGQGRERRERQIALGADRTNSSVVLGSQQAVGVLHDSVAADAESFGRVEGGRELARIHVGRAHVMAAATGANRLEPLESLLDRCGVVGLMGEEELDSVDAKSLKAAREPLFENGGVKAAARPVEVRRGNLGSETNSVGDGRVALDQPSVWSLSEL